jgi:carbonic anhydrase
LSPALYYLRRRPYTLEYGCGITEFIYYDAARSTFFFREALMREQLRSKTGVARREFLQSSIPGIVAGIAAPALLNLAAAPRVRAQTDLSPEGALRELVTGNERFAANRLTSIEHDLSILKEKTLDKQEPFAAVLACADSRLPVELIFDQTIGHIFVTRVAGNVVTPELIASLEYGVAVLGVKVLLVLGHSNCGAVKAAMKADAVPGQISVLYQHLQPAVEKSGGDFTKAIAANARIQTELLRTSSTVMSKAVKEGKLKIESAVYDLATGKVVVT